MILEVAFFMAEVVKKRYWNFIVYEDSAPARSRGRAR